MHSAHSHHHAPSGATQFRLAISLTLTALFVGVETVAGFLANSMALLTDAAHNLTDVLTLLLTGYALHLTRKPANARKTFGYHRAGILAALLNSSGLALVAVAVFVEAYHRLRNPITVDSELMFYVSMAAFVVNAGTAWLLHAGSRHDLNLRSAFQHLLGDAISTLGATLAAVAIFYTGQDWIDPAVSGLIGALILFNAWTILRETVDILLESAPRDIDLKRLVEGLQGFPGVVNVHDLHLWSLSQNLRMLSVHIVTNSPALADATDTREAIEAWLAEHFNISHATIQLELKPCAETTLFCGMTGVATGHSHDCVKP